MSSISPLPLGGGWAEGAQHSAVPDGMDFAEDLTQRPAATAVLTNALRPQYPALTKIQNFGRNEHNSELVQRCTRWFVRFLP